MLRSRSSMFGLTILIFLFSIECFALDCTQIRVNGAASWKPVSFRATAGSAVDGILIDVAKEVFAALNIEIQFDFNKPWKRILNDLDTEKIDMVAGAFFTKAREKKYLYSDPITAETVHIFVHPDEKYSVSELTDFDQKVGVKLYSVSYGESLDQYIKEHPKIIEVQTTDSLVNLVARKRVDFAIVSLYEGRNRSQELGLDQQFSLIFMPAWLSFIPRPV
jgi:polar amino acid transport system substrate-binding protein